MIKARYGAVKTLIDKVGTGQVRLLLHAVRDCLLRANILMSAVQVALGTQDWAIVCAHSCDMLQTLRFLSKQTVRWLLWQAVFRSVVV